MHETPMHRRDALAFIPAMLAMPTALAQGGAGQAGPGGGTAVSPSVRAKSGAPGAQEGLTMPFAVAACWADDFGALAQLRLRSRLDSSIGFSFARQPASDDESCAMLVSAGAAVECIAMLASASMAGWTIVYQGAKGTDDVFEVYVRLGQVRHQPDALALRAALGIFARPDPRGAFDPQWKAPDDCLEKIRVAMIEQNSTAVVIKPERKAALLKALATLSKASPAFASAVGAAELWGDGCTPVLMGRGPASSLSTAITAGRGMQRAGLFAHQSGASVDVRVILPGVFEAAAASSAEATAAAKDLTMLIEAPGFEPLAVVRVGKVLKPQPRMATLAESILAPSVAAPAVAPPVAGDGA